jgi:hypothetical protein
MLAQIAKHETRNQISRDARDEHLAPVPGSHEPGGAGSTPRNLTGEGAISDRSIRREREVARRLDDCAQ